MARTQTLQAWSCCHHLELQRRERRPTEVPVPANSGGMVVTCLCGENAIAITSSVQLTSPLALSLATVAGVGAARQSRSKPATW